KNSPRLSKAVARWNSATRSKNKSAGKSLRASLLQVFTKITGAMTKSSSINICPRSLLSNRKNHRGFFHAKYFQNSERGDRDSARKRHCRTAPRGGISARLHARKRPDVSSHARRLRAFTRGRRKI